MTTEEEIRYDRTLLGVEHPFGPFVITEEMILAFSLSTGETDPRYTDAEKAKALEHGGVVAPPTFCNLFITNIHRPDIKLEFGDTGLLASQAIENLALIRPGDTLKAAIKLKEVYAKRGRSGQMVFTVWETHFVNQKGETVARIRESFARRKSRTL